MDKRFLATVGVIIAVFVGFLVLGNDKEADAPKTDAQPTQHTKGQGSANVTLMEYGDFQCPACAQYYPMVEQIFEKYQDQITFQFRHFPLTSIHPNAFAGSRAAEAASKQGKFWEMYSQLYTNQNEWGASNTPSKVFEKYAKTIGIDVAKFKEDFASRAVNDAIQADLATGEEKDVASTPTFILNGETIKNPVSIEDFEKVIDAAIAKNKSKND